MKRILTIITICTLAVSLLTGCGKAPKVSGVPSELSVKNPDGVKFEVSRADRNDISYVLKNGSDTGLYYEYHILTTLQMQKDGEWYDLEFKNFAMTADFRIESIPREETAFSYHVRDYYDSPLKTGTYRLICRVYPTEEDLMHANEEMLIVLGAEFTV